MNKKQPIAIVGLSGVFPGADTPDKDNMERFWDNIVTGQSSIKDVPPERWIIPPDSIVSQTPEHDKVLSKKAGLITGFSFDPSEFDIDPALLSRLDPMYHLVLSSGKNALTGCYSNDEIKKRTGVILAAIALPTDASSAFTRKILGKSIEIKLFGARAAKTDCPISKEEVLASRVTSLPASLMAKCFGFGGGSYTLDAACSSSLYSIKLACDALHSKKCDMMIAGGVSRPESLFTQKGFTQLTALSPSGICAPFDHSADGLVVGEGAGIIVLKRLDDALTNGDTIHGLLYGAGLSNDIGGNLLAPDTEGQVRAINLAYANSGWSPFDIDHIECHGTGTPVGDKTELNSLKTVWGETGWDKNRCAIGSVKSMIGHLLTAAGIAGTIKTILALKNKVIPPSLNYTRPHEKSPLINGPFYVPKKAEEWKKTSGRPRRAAMSAFGFGGINAHLLIEEWAGNPPKSFFIPETIGPPAESDVAIIGMGTFVNNAKTLKEFQHAVLSGQSLINNKPPENKWYGAEATVLKLTDINEMPCGNYMEKLDISVGEFHIPPNEISDILPQHLLMLKAASSAIEDAGIEKRSEKPRMGSAIGINFDFEATNFHLRWNLENEIEHWNEHYDLNLTDSEKKDSLNTLKKELFPPLTPAKTTGALGGIIASRVAKEFKLGGPSFIVSSEDTSGLTALEIGIDSIRNNETDTYLAGAVDLPGEIRNLTATSVLRQFSSANSVSPFDKNSNGFLPGEGAVAVVLKRLDKAIEDGDRIYSVIKGCGNASSGGIDEPVSETAYETSLNRALKNSGVLPESVGFIETHGSASSAENKIEATVINNCFSRNSAPEKQSIAIGSTIPVTGHLGAASGLASLIKASLSLYQEILPPLVNFKEQKEDRFKKELFHIPVSAQYWLRDRIDGPRVACVSSMTTEGNCSHILLESLEKQSDKAEEKIRKERQFPLGNNSGGLFIIEGDSKTELINCLREFKNFLKEEKIQPFLSDMYRLATIWQKKNPVDFTKNCSLSLISGKTERLQHWIKEAETAISNDIKKTFNGPDGIYYTPIPIGPDAGTGFVYPGSGNHYIGMGRDTGVLWPEVFRSIDHKTRRLKSQLLPEYFIPQSLSWKDDWEISAQKKADETPHAAITAHVSHGVLQTELLKFMEIQPSSILSYSLGESAGYFATGVWQDRDEMLKRMENTTLFNKKLAGRYASARQAWQIPEDADFNWKVAFLNRAKDEVEKALKGFKYIRLLIVNTPEECVVGGIESELQALIDRLGCSAIDIKGVITVHCDALQPVSEEYRQLHLLKTTPPPGLKFYSCYHGKSYEVTKESAADSVLNQALFGFDFPAIVQSAYEDGTRIFIETGPGASCSRMIEKILPDKKILCISSCVKGEAADLTLAKLAGSLASERIPFNTGFLFPENTDKTDNLNNNIKIVSIMVGGRPPTLSSPSLKKQKKFYRTPEKIRENEHIPVKKKTDFPSLQIGCSEKKRLVSDKNDVAAIQNSEIKSISDTIISFTENQKKTADAHTKFIAFSNSMSKSFADTIHFQTDLIEKTLRSEDKNLVRNLKIEKPFKNDLTAPSDFISKDSSPVSTALFSSVPVEKKLRPEPAFSREMCMEFATGSIEKVLGHRFAEVDTYDVRVRLPDEPLMLVDRILTIEGEIGSLKSGKVVTEHDVHPDAWYLDGGRAPVCISIEAGQADLFLCSYLGIDLAVKGKRSYRLLDAVAQFHGGLPKPGDTIRYEIEIDRFISQGDTYLFFFHFNGFLGDQHIISMRNGCAGFFTSKEVKESGGIVLTKEETAPVPGIKAPDWRDLVDFFDSGSVYQFDEEKINALRQGDAEAAFGQLFKDKRISKSMAIPGGRMKLVDRVISLDPAGGRYGLGRIKAEADIHPDDWFLTCHFVDDMVMPGTLMYECCMHTLRIFTMRMGWITDKENVCCEPVPDVKSVLKCRGPVTVETKQVFYVIDIKEIGYNPEPYVIADAHMYAHDEHIVMFRDMSMKLSGITKTEIEASWE